MKKILITILLVSATSFAWAQISLPQLQSLQYSTTSFGNALNFNGTNTYGIGQVYVQDSITDFTIEFWCKNTGTDGTNDRVYSSYNNNGFHIAKSASQLKLLFSDMGGTVSWSTPCTFESNSWIHFAFVKNNSVLTVYKNATSVATYTVIADSILPTMFRLGSNIDGEGENGNFTIDELRIWNSVRTRSDIQKYMYSIVNPNINASLKLYYRFDQGDASGTNTNERGLYNSAIN